MPVNVNDFKLAHFRHQIPQFKFPLKTIHRRDKLPHSATQLEGSIRGPDPFLKTLRLISVIVAYSKGVFDVSMIIKLHKVYHMWFLEGLGVRIFASS